MLYSTSLALIYNWKFVPFDHLHPVTPPPASLFLVITNLISFSMNLFVFEV